MNREDLRDHVTSARTIIKKVQDDWKSHPSRDESIDEIILQLIAADVDLEWILSEMESDDKPKHFKVRS